MKFESPVEKGPEGSKEALACLEAGDPKGALEITLRSLFVDRKQVDLSKEKIVEIKLDQWGEETRGHDTDRGYINEALELLEDPLNMTHIKDWIVEMFEDMKAFPRGAAYRPDSGLAGLAPEVIQSKLIEKWVTSNPEIPGDVRVWMVQLVKNFPDFLSSPDVTQVKVIYEENNHGPCVTISYRTTSASQNRSFREKYLKWFAK